MTLSLAPAASMNARFLSLHTDDGLTLGGTHWSAPEAPQGMVLLAPATGVPHRFYRRFAEFLVRDGFEVMSFDWSGIATSRGTLDLHDPRLTMRQWGERDLTTAIAWAERQAAGRPLTFLGHSYGGQALGLAANADRVSRAVFVASQHGWMGLWPKRLHLRLHFLWRFAIPATVATMGRFPSSWLGMGETLPAGVAREWAMWCTRREHMGTWDGHAKLRLPIHAWSFEDDDIAPQEPAAALLREYRHATVTHEHRPTEGIGHFGFFRESERTAELWRRAAAFLAR